MCDKGLLETDSSMAKLEYCIVIDKQMQDYILNGINKLLKDGETCCFITPLPGKYPEENKSTNTVEIGSNQRKYLGQYNHTICSFSLKEMSGCCGILVSYWMVVHKPYQNLGIAKFLQEVKEKIAKQNGYSIMMATTVADNKIENKILQDNGWAIINKFNNKRTTHDVLVWTKNLLK